MTCDCIAVDSCHCPSSTELVVLWHLGKTSTLRTSCYLQFTATVPPHSVLSLLTRENWIKIKVIRNIFYFTVLFKSWWKKKKNSLKLKARNHFVLKMCHATKTLFLSLMLIPIWATLIHHWSLQMSPVQLFLHTISKCTNMTVNVSSKFVNLPDKGQLCVILMNSVELELVQSNSWRAGDGQNELFPLCRWGKPHCMTSVNSVSLNHND